MRVEKVMKNSAIGLVTQIIVLVTGFLTQIVFNYYLGKSNYGLNSVLNSLLNMLTLAELGVGSAITYHLYKPLAEGDRDTIASIMALFRKVYFIIGCVVFILGMGMLLVIPLVVRDEGADYAYIRFVFFIQLMSTVSTYFLSYKRMLLYADQKNYVCALYDTLMNIIFSILRIVFLVINQSYVIYSVLMVLQQVFANIFIAYHCNRLYPEIRQKNLKPYAKAKNLFADTKNILVGKIAVYIYSSTDNLVISTFLGTVSVAELNYYVYISNALRTIVNSVLTSMAPAIGNFLQGDRDKGEMRKLFNQYTFIRRFIATVTATGLIVCSSRLVYLCYGGADAVLPILVVVLIAADVYISITSGAINEMISVLGLFQHEKYLNAIGAAMNIIISILFVQRIGIPGVLVGTVLSQSFFWVSKCILVYLKYFEEGIMVYWRKVLAYFVVDVGQILLLLWGCQKLFPNPTVGGFIGSVVLCLIVIFGFTVLFFHRTDGFRFAWDIALGLLRKVRRTKG